MFQPKTREFILTRMINRTVARTDLNDLNDGSSVKQVLAAASREDDDQNYQMTQIIDLFDLDTCIGADLDERAKEMNPQLVTRDTPRKAAGSVVFSRVGTSGDVSIAIGTEVEYRPAGAASPITFVTTALGTIADTFSTSGSVAVIAREAGEAGNVDPGTVTSFVAKPSGVDYVTNPAKFTTGRDLESDDAFRKRIKLAVASLARCHNTGLLGALLGLEDAGSGKRVLFAQIYEDPFSRGNVTAWIDDGNGTAEDTTVVSSPETVIASAVGGETVFTLPHAPIKKEAAYAIRVNAVTLTEGTDYTLNPASGQVNLLPAVYPSGLTAADAVDWTGTYFTGLIALAQKVIDGDPADRATYPGYRAGGILVRVLSPLIQQQVISANLTWLQGYDGDTVIVAVLAAIEGYINTLGIGDDIILAELTERCMAVPGMYDIAFTAPTSSIVVGDGTLARVQSGNVSLN
jgi:uncharacterized phage protein gp47/JayE